MPGHNGSSTETVAAAKPKIFLDKSPRIVEYQLKRLSNAQLLMVDRATDHVKYVPVFSAILVRSGMAVSDRELAARSLATLRKSSYSAEILAALSTLDNTQPESQRLARELSSLLLAQDQSTLREHLSSFENATQSSSSAPRRAALAAIISAGQSQRAVEIASKSVELQVDLLASVPLVNQARYRAELSSKILELLGDDQPKLVRQQAIEALASIPESFADSFHRVAALVDHRDLGVAAVRTLLRIPAAQRDERVVQSIAEKLVKIAEATPAEQRTSDSFVDLTQLLESLLPVVSAEKARNYRQRMREISVRVIRIRTVEEEMRYDVKFFAAEAGRPVQLVLQNDDLMPHNLVVTQPGFLKEVALLAATMTPDATTDGKQYVPKSEKVLLASSMVQAGKSDRITFDAPQAPGEYPYVCTYPNHWLRMYGVMVVVPDLEAWQRAGKPPTDPLGNNRSFVKNWKTEDLLADLPNGLRGRTSEIGARIFQEATCAQCHKLRGAGGTVGPDLTDLLARWKGDTSAVLREILDPSHKIDPKYAAHSILTDTGKVYSGVIVAEDTASISLINQPDQKSPTKVLRSEIEEMVKPPKSIMPAALMDQFTKDEIFELLAYLTVNHITP